MKNSSINLFKNCKIIYITLQEKVFGVLLEYRTQAEIVIRRCLLFLVRLVKLCTYLNGTIKEAVILSWSIE